MTERLPPSDRRVLADSDLRVIADGRVLIGGSPLRVMRLSATGGRAVVDWLAGAPIGESAARRKLARRLLDGGMVHPADTDRGPRVAATPQTPVRGTGMTVVVPVKDDQAGLDRLLAALPEVAVVVVDDGSAIPIGAPSATVIRRDESGGPGVARMTGLNAVETEFVAFLDADVEPGPDLFDGLLGHFADPAVVAVAPRVRSRAGASTLARYEVDFSPLDLGDRPAIVGPRRRMSYVPTAALVARRAAIDEVGGFDPDLRFGEDVDLVWRLVDAGGTVRYDPTVEVVHEPRRSWGSWLRQRVSYGSSASALAERHGAVVAPARCSWWSAFAWWLVALRRPVAGVVVAAGSTLALSRKLADVPDAAWHSLRIAGWGHLHAGRGLAQAIGRVWWPVAVPLAIVRPRLRPAVIAALTIGPVIEWRASDRRLGLAGTMLLRIADQMAYGVGVWRSVLGSGSALALRPEFVSGPNSNGEEPAATVSPS